jgi:Fe-S oxidoreductase
MEILNSNLRRAEKLTADQIGALAQLDSPLVNALAGWLNKQLACAHCKRCTRHCEVLSDPDLDIGLVEQEFQRMEQLDADARPAAVYQLMQDRPELYHALRRCCFCGHCTSGCATHMIAPMRMREWRELFMQAGYLNPNDSKIVMVDNEWHIFSAYRAVYGIGYPEFLQLADAAADAASTVDTLFFPGCSLVSYSSDLVRKVGNWLNAAGFSWALSQDCCGSPLMSAGLFERSVALRTKLLEQMRAAGIKRVVTVCPGCGEELMEVIGDEIEIVPLAELILDKLEDPNASVMTDDVLVPQAKTTPTLTFFDSCHDRTDTRHGASIRKLLSKVLPDVKQIEMDHRGKNTLCCGAGGAVAAYDPDISQRRVWRIIDEARDTKAAALITACPTCTYTIAQACLAAEPERGIPAYHYLELVFNQPTDWQDVFTRLESMWTGDYGAWLTQTFY